MRLGEIHVFHETMQRSSTEQRVRLLAQAVATSPHDLNELHLLCSVNALDEQAFATAMRECIARDRGNVLALQALLWASRRAGRLEEARACIAQLLALDPDDQTLLLDRLRLELVSPGPNAEMHIDDALGRIDDALTQASYAFQLGLRFPHRARPRQADDLKRWMTRIAAATVRSTGPTSSLWPTRPNTVWTEVLHRLIGAGSVAIVGNGPSLLDKNFGAMIDAKDLVIRINFPVIRDHEADVGSRTDIMVFSEGLLGRLTAFLDRDPSYRNLPLLAVSARPLSHDRLSPSTSEGLRLCVMPAAVRDSLTRMSYTLATTGCLISCLCAIMNAGSIELFGFDFYKDKTRPHYFSGHDQTFLGHDVAYERFFVEDVIPSIA